MKLYLKTIGISMKYTFKAAALPFVALLLCLLFALSVTQQENQIAKPSVGILCLDTHPLVPILTALVSDSPELEEFVELRILSAGEPVDGLAAVVTLPQGFIDSMLVGENLSPTVQLGSSGISAVYIRELCTAIERYLSSAQTGIYAAISAADGVLTPEASATLITEINLSYITLLINRMSMLSKEFHSYDSYYILWCIVSILLFLLCGALGGAVPSLLAMARSMRGIRKSDILLFAGGSCGVFLFCLPVTQLCLTVAFGVEVWRHPATLLALALLLSSVSIFFFVAVGRGGIAAVILCGFTLLTALFSGLIIPLEILPQAVTRLAPLLPIYHVRELVSVMSGAYNGGVMVGATVHCALWLSGAWLLWNRGVHRV